MSLAAACSLQAANRPARRPLQPAAPWRPASAPQLKVHAGAEADWTSFATAATAGLAVLSGVVAGSYATLDTRLTEEFAALDKTLDKFGAFNQRQDDTFAAVDQRLDDRFAALDQRLDANDKALTELRTEVLAAIAAADQRAEQRAAAAEQCAAALQEPLVELVRKATAALAAAPNYEQPMPPKPAARQQQVRTGGVQAHAFAAPCSSLGGGSSGRGRVLAASKLLPRAW